MGLARGAVGWISDAKRMNVSCDSVLPCPRGGATPRGTLRRQASLDLVTAGFLQHFGRTIPRFRTTYAPPLPQHIVVDDCMDTKASKGEWATLENFLNSCLYDDSCAWRAFLRNDLA